MDTDKSHSMPPLTEIENMEHEDNIDDESQDEEDIGEDSVIEQESASGKISATKGKPPAVKKRRKHKPKDFPKRPLSAYNIFFKETREVMLKEKEREVGKDNVDFQSMVKDIAKKWKALPPQGRERVEKMAKEDLARYKGEVRSYEEELVKRNRREREESALKKRKLEEDEAASRVREEQDRILAAAESAQARAGHLDYQRRYYDDPYGVVDGAVTAEELRRILEDELLQIEAMREIKLRQLAELQAGILPHNFSGAALGSSFGHSVGALSTGSTGGISAEAEMELLRRRHALASGGGLAFAGGAGGAGTIGRSHMVSELDLLRAGHGGGPGALMGNGGGLYGDHFLLGQHQGGSGGLAGLSRQELAMREEAMLRSLREREHQDLVLSSRLAAAGGERRGVNDWEVERRAAAEHHARLEEEELLRRAGRAGVSGEAYLGQHSSHSASRGHHHHPSSVRRDSGGYDHREPSGMTGRGRAREDDRGNA